LILKRLEISYFRNLGSASLDLAPGLNFFFGENGAGKTAVLEAAYFLSRARSFRSAHPRNYIQHGAESVTVRGLLTDATTTQEAVALSKSLGGASVLRVNGEPEPKMSEAARRLPVQVMLPDVGQLVFGPPAERRKWLDWGVFHVEPRYLKSVRGFGRALKQRNAALKQRAPAGEGLGGIEEWTQQFVEYASQVTSFREAYLKQFYPVFNKTLAAIAPALDVTISYEQGWPSGESLNKVLGDLASRELKLGASLAGPHRADLELKVAIDPGRKTRAASELSRGQGKALASALKIAQATMLSGQTSTNSLLLIDDVGAELDDHHNMRFFELLRAAGCQILAASTKPPGNIAAHFPENEMRMFHVKQGEIQEGDINVK